MDIPDSELRNIGIQTLLEDFISVYYIDFVKNHVVEVKTSPVFSLSGGSNSGTISDNIKAMVALADPEYQQAFLDFVNIERLQKELTKENRTEFIYSSHVTGSLRWVKIRMLVAQRQGDLPVAIVMACSSVYHEQMEKMKAEEEARKAKEESKLKSMFVQNISHDIRTPLNALVGYSQLLGMPEGFLTNDERTEFCGYINDSADMLTMLVDDVLSVSDIEHGMLTVNKVDTYCNNICMKAINCSRMRVQPGVKLYKTSEVDNLYKINTDPKRVQQILVNFLSNACKHTTEGEIHMHCSLTENPGKMTISVADTGCGVSPDMAEEIFKRFSALDTNSGSHGLGLDICGDLARRLGGSVALDTSYTGGARFYLILPLDN